MPTAPQAMGMLMTTTERTSRGATMRVERLEFPSPRSTEGSEGVGRRTHREPPKLNPTFVDVDLADLRRMRSGLGDEESRVSYWRRIVQARIDLITTKNRPGDRGEGLARVLADSRSSHRRLAALRVDSVNSLPPLPDLAELWDRVIPDDPHDRALLVAQLQQAEKELSEYRHELHRRIDEATQELIARYRETPSLALTALHERLASPQA